MSQSTINALPLKAVVVGNEIIEISENGAGSFKTTLSAIVANYQLLSEKGAVNGYAGLDASQNLLLTNFPSGTSLQVLRRNGANTALEFADVVAGGGITSINADTTAAQILAGTSNRISLVDAGNTHTFDIDSAYVGQSSLTTLGTITTGVWNGTDVAFANIQDINTSRILGRATGGGGVIEELTGTQATVLLDLFTPTLQGLVPLSGGGTVNFLRADGTWSLPTTTVYVVAAADATQKAKDNADFVCDGVADEVQINLAIAELPTTGNVIVTGSSGFTRPNEGGMIQFTEGSFQLAAPIDWSGRSNIAFNGRGPATVIANMAVLGEHAFQAINVSVAGQVEDRCYFSNMLIMGNPLSGDGIHIEGIEYTHLHNVFAQDNGVNGLYFEAETGASDPGAENVHIEQCQFQFNGQDGIHVVNGHEFFVVDCTVEENLRHGIYSLDGVGQLRLGLCNIEDHASGDGVHVVNGSVHLTGCLLEDTIEVNASGSGTGLFMSNSTARGVTITSQSANGATCAFSNCKIDSLTGPFWRLRIATTRITEVTGLGNIEIHQAAQISTSEIQFVDNAVCELHDGASLTVIGNDLDKGSGANVYTFQRADTTSNRAITFVGNTLDPDCDLTFDGALSTQMQITFGDNTLRTSNIIFTECDFMTVGDNVMYSSTMIFNDCDRAINFTDNILRSTTVTFNANCDAVGNIAGNTLVDTSSIVTDPTTNLVESTSPPSSTILAGIGIANVWGAFNQNIATTGKWQEAGVNISPIGDHDQYISAGFFNEVTASAIATRTISTGDNRKAVAFYSFLNGANEFITCKWIPPENYDGGTVTVVVDWTSGVEAVGDVLWAVAAVFVSDGDDLTAAATNYGTEVILTADTQTTIDFEQHTARSAAITPANTYVAGDALYIRLQRRGADGGDTFTQPAQFMGLNMRITTDAAVAA